MFAGIFLLYLVFLCPTFYNGDSPLLATAAFALDPAHPPGYPLYVMLGKAMTFIPLGSVAFKLNLLSALAGAAASALVYKSAKLLTEDEAASIFAALLSAVMPLAWAESTKAEVYTLNSALVMAIFYLGLKFLKEDADRRLIFLAGFVLGLGMGNHHTIGFMAFPLGLAVLLGARDRKTILYCMAFFLLGLGVYFFSYVRSVKFLQGEALFAYSGSSTLENFWTTFSRSDYQSSVGIVAAPAGSPLSFLMGGYNVARYLIYGNMGIFALLAIFGMVPLWKQKRELMFVSAAFLSYAILLSAMVYTFRDPAADDLFLLNPYLLPALYISAVLAGCGAFYLLGVLSRKITSLRRPLALGLALLPLALVLPNSLAERNLSRYYLAEDYAENVLGSLPPESVYITVSDSSYFPLAYKSFVERNREDVLFLYSDEGEIITQVAPGWRYASLFPDLPAKGHFEPVGIQYLEGKALYAFEPGFLSEEAQTAFASANYIQSFMLTPRTDSASFSGGEADFVRAFDLFVFERSIGERASDRYSAEMNMSAFITLAHYAYLMSERGDAGLASTYYENAFKLITPKGLAHYMAHLEAEGREDEAAAFADAMEGLSAKYPDAREIGEGIRKRFL